MKFYSVILLIFLFSTCFGQVIEPESQPERESLMIGERYYIGSRFPGGDIEMVQFIQENLEYPTCYELGLLTIYVEFIVLKSGKITDIKVVRPENNKLINEMVFNLMEKMPNWIPAESEGELIDDRVRLPIIIHLE